MDTSLGKARGSTLLSAPAVAALENLGVSLASAGHYIDTIHYNSATQRSLGSLPTAKLCGPSPSRCLSVTQANLQSILLASCASRAAASGLHFSPSSAPGPFPIAAAPGGTSFTTPLGAFPFVFTCGPNCPVAPSPPPKRRAGPAVGGPVASGGGGDLPLLCSDALFAAANAAAPVDGVLGRPLWCEAIVPIPAAGAGDSGGDATTDAFALFRAHPHSALEILSARGPRVVVRPVSPGGDVVSVAVRSISFAKRLATASAAADAAAGPKDAQAAQVIFSDLTFADAEHVLCAALLTAVAPLHAASMRVIRAQAYISHEVSMRRRSPAAVSSALKSAQLAGDTSLPSEADRVAVAQGTAVHHPWAAVAADPWASPDGRFVAFGPARYAAPYATIDAQASAGVLDALRVCGSLFPPAAGAGGSGEFDAAGVAAAVRAYGERRSAALRRSQLWATASFRWRTPRFAPALGVVPAVRHFVFKYSPLFTLTEIAAVRGSAKHVAP